MQTPRDLDFIIFSIIEQSILVLLGALELRHVTSFSSSLPNEQPSVTFMSQSWPSVLFFVWAHYTTQQDRED